MAHITDIEIEALEGRIAGFSMKIAAERGFGRTALARRQLTAAMDDLRQARRRKTDKSRARNVFWARDMFRRAVQSYHAEM